ncbi:hypothetical protein AVEN_11052-1 [Araneus ventricosus]|uniref:Uncharacterized protein n=1 Tax=Araneus ventricosus TaxID=182803 RepID=A0A4Y2NG04_ARAVE|nr:hypothetical protein AVEN_11052-1 [Araneus ventricosus]
MKEVLKLASTRKSSSREIIEMTGLNICKKTICNIVTVSKSFQYRVYLSKTILLIRIQVQRLQCERQMMVRDDQRLQVSFSAEKQWNLDSPDGYKYYCRDLEREKIFSQNATLVVDLLKMGLLLVQSLGFFSRKMNL